MQNTMRYSDNVASCSAEVTDGGQRMGERTDVRDRFIE